jgi:hypothetical protein
MLSRYGKVLVVMTALIAPATVRGQAVASTPTPEEVVKRAIDVAGGYEAFSRLGILLAEVTKDEVAQDGKQTSSVTKNYFMAPGPTPGRIEIPKGPVVSADDGKDGWALIGGNYDARPSTKVMIKRLLQTNLFPLMLPFSLYWNEVAATDVTPEMVGNVPVWRLTVKLTKTFFHSPQIATTWTVDVHRQTYAVVQAESPATDLGRGIEADGMRITWTKPQVVRGLVLPGEQRIVGLSETGAEKAHNRVDKIRYELVDPSQAMALFANPVPPDKRPSQKVGPEALPKKTP